MTNFCSESNENGTNCILFEHRKPLVFERILNCAYSAQGTSGAKTPAGAWRTVKYGDSMIARKLVSNVNEAADFLSVLGNSKRLLIMSNLLAGELSVGAIAERVSLSQSALSQHLAKLRSARLVETRRDRQMIYYSCRSSAVARLFHTLDGIFEDAEDSRSRLATAAS